MNSIKSLQDLRQQLAELEATVARIKGEGDYLQGVRLERSPAAGTASRNAQTASKYARLRSGKGNFLPNGKKSQYVAMADIGKIEAEIARGTELSKVEKEISQVRAKLQKGLEMARSLGIEC